MHTVHLQVRMHLHQKAQKTAHHGIFLCRVYAEIVCLMMIISDLESPLHAPGIRTRGLMMSCLQLLSLEFEHKPETWDLHLQH